MTKDQFPVGTLLSSDCWSVLILAWRSDGKRATVLFEDGEIEFKRSSMSLKSLCPNSDIRGGFPIQFEIFSSHQQTTTT